MTDTALTPPRPTVADVLRRRDVSAVILVSFVVMIGLGLVLPILPLYARSFGVGYGAAGLMISGFGLTRLAFDLAAGSIVDRFGERRTGTASLVWIGLCAAVAAAAPTYTAAVISWSIGGIGSALMFASTYGYLLRVVPQRAMARTLGVFYGSFNAGIIVGGVAGGLLAARFGLASPIAVYAVVLFTAAAILFMRLPDSPGPARSSEAAEPRLTFLQLMRRRSFIAVLAVNFAYLWFVAAIFDTLVPLFGKEQLGMSPAGVGAVFAVAIAAEFAVLYPAGALADRHGGKIVIVPALAALAASVVALGHTTAPITLAVCIGIVGVASGFAGVPPAAMLAEVVPPSSSGRGVGAFRFAGDLAFVVGPVTVGASIGNFGFTTAFAIAAVPVAVAMALVMTTEFRRP